jgi:hypothetical protein
MKKINSIIPIQSLDIGTYCEDLLACDTNFIFMCKTAFNEYKTPEGFLVNENPQATHVIMSKTGHVFLNRLLLAKPLMNNLAEKLNSLDIPPADLISLKVNIQFPASVKENEIEIPHTDFTEAELNKKFGSSEGFTVVLYLNDNDGKTTFFDDNGNCTDSIPSIQGTGAVFPINTVHCGSNPTDSLRIVLNANFRYL